MISPGSADASASHRIAGVSSQNAIAEGTTTRQWSFHAFEWVVRDVSKLRDYVENGAATEDAADPDGEDFEILRESAEMGDSKFKVEIWQEGTPVSAIPIPAIRADPPRLCLHITCLSILYAHQDYETSASMFAAIKCQDDRMGERGARADWVWENWQNNWVFRHDNEVWDCPLPSLSELLENPRIQATDSFVICIQMHSPVGPFYPQQPSAYFVPRDLLEGLEASLDNPNTGDVQFVCLERTQQESDKSGSPLLGVPTSPRSVSSQSSSSTQTLARKRIIYAHSDILIRRSEYFATMLSSSFAENASTLLPGERKVYTIVVEEADFVTIYWLLKWVYANWLLFRKEDDPRQAVDGVGAGWSARDVCSPGAADEWEWKVFPKAGTSLEAHGGGGVSDARSVTSGGSGRSTGEAAREKPKPVPQVPPALRTSSTSGPPNTQPSPPSTRHAPPPPPVRRPSHGPLANAPGMARAGPPPSPTNARSTKAGGAVPAPVTSPSASHFTHKSPRARGGGGATGNVALSVDPHPHPTPVPAPASALSMYQIAHRYGMPGLGTLALEHIVATITPQSSFAVLLASASWDELHALVEDYVVEKWDEVSVSDEFEQCCQEVASGEWGPEGGRTLMALFRRLRSPSAMGYARS
ncbi:hypothetical protein BD413DRAFT_648910 [Trametes elegans]|nr:hypothetical protein BD413DRAFT_648910 [Trametes elegans]